MSAQSLSQNASISLVTYKGVSKLISNIEIYRSNPSVKQDKNLLELFNIIQFSLLFYLDLNSALYQMIHNKYPDQYNLLPRIIALITYEGIDDLSSLIGKKFYNIIENLGFKEDRINEAKHLHKVLSGIKNKYSKYLRGIRNIAIAHKDHNTHKQLEKIMNINKDNMIILGTEVTRFLSDFQKYSNSIFVSL